MKVTPVSSATRMIYSSGWCQTGGGSHKPYLELDLVQPILGVTLPVKRLVRTMCAVRRAHVCWFFFRVAWISLMRAAASEMVEFVSLIACAILSRSWRSWGGTSSSSSSIFLAGNSIPFQKSRLF